jgi:hypothetical protein
MHQDRIAQARTVARGINIVERRSAAALEDSVTFMSQLITARRELNLPPTYSATAMARAAAATNLMAQAMEELAACHEQLVVKKGELGLDAVAFGDPCPWTLEAGAPAADQPPLRIVA